MRGILRIGFAMLLGGWLVAAAAVAWGQVNNAGGNNAGNNGGGNTNNTNNTNNNGNSQNVGGTLPAGVIISPDGVLRVKPFTDRSGNLTRTRIMESRARLGAEVAKISPMRKISLPRLEAAIAERLAAGKEPTDEMKALAGLTRVQYVFYYPDTKDIVIAGPAEGFFADFTGRLLGLASGRTVVELQDLAAARRSFPPAGKQA